MKSIYDSAAREELIKRIHTLTPQNQAQWGKMDVFQMLKHTTMSEDMMLGKTIIKRVFIGRILGKMFLKKALKDESPFSKNSPTASILRTVGASGDLEQQKKEWISRIEQYPAYTDPKFVHPFFGPMNKEQIGIMAYKHADHHLRQFGA